MSRLGQGNPRLLVVDDDRYLLLALRQTLELAGYAVDTFSLGQEALIAAQEQAYAAVLSDIRMPGLDGLELLQRLQAIEDRKSVV